jgi:hypothetical protein
MFDVKTMLERQARWQKSRAKLSWTEKLRMAEILREAALAMRSSRGASDLRTGQESDNRREDSELK